MLRILKARIQQKHRTMKYPAGPLPPMPDRYAGRPVLDGACPDGCRLCQEACPVQAIRSGAGGLLLDTGRCLFCRTCVEVCPQGTILFSRNHQLAAARREDLLVAAGSPAQAEAVSEKARRFFRRSLKLRQVSAGGCNACEADTNVLNTPFFDLSRFGIDFVASPRHADGIHVTGPISRNMKAALLTTYEAVPSPKVVIASGACSISGGPFYSSDEIVGDLSELLPVDLYIPGCPPHPLTTLHALLTFFK